VYGIHAAAAFVSFHCTFERISDCNATRHNSLTPDKVMNVLMYGSLCTSVNPVGWRICKLFYASTASNRWWKQYVFWSSCRPLFVHPLTFILSDEISLLLSGGFQLNLAQIFSTWMGIAEKVFKVRGERSRSCVRMYESYNVRGTHLDGMALRLTCLTSAFYQTEIESALVLCYHQ